MAFKGSAVNLPRLGSTTMVNLLALYTKSETGHTFFSTALATLSLLRRPSQCVTSQLLTGTIFNFITQAFTFLREFVLGSNTTGLVTNSSGVISVIGGENSTLAEDILPGQDEIYYGSAATQSTFVYPSATIAAWKTFIRTATATPSSSLSAVNSAQRNIPWSSCWVSIAFLFFLV